jgi:ComF family protein
MLKQAFSGFFNLFYPNMCHVCGHDLVQGEDVVCTKCLYKLPLTRFWKHADNPVAQTFWGRVNINHACAYFFFAKGSKYRPLLHKLKYKGKPEIGIFMGKEFGRVLMGSEFYADVDQIVPVPLHPKKLRIRGYNQAEVIAKGMAFGLNTQVSTTHLLRSEFTETQTRKTRAERVLNVAEAFTLNNASELEGKHLLIVDDVVTTGATLEACAQKLLEIPNCRVSIAALAYATT